MAFTYIHGSATSVSGTFSTVAVTLASTPAAGSLICVTVDAYSSSGVPVLLSVVDNATSPNTYTISPNSPASAQSANASCVWLAYLLSAPSGAGTTITATFSAVTNEPDGGGDIWADVFTVSGGSQTFDKDIAGSGTTGTTINSPSITPTNAGSLLYSGAAPATAIIHPADEGTLGSWTGNEGSISGTTGAAAEYDLSASTATAVDYTTSGSGAWNAIAMAFYISAGGGGVPPVDDSVFQYQPLPFDPIVSVW